MLFSINRLFNSNQSGKGTPKINAQNQIQIPKTNTLEQVGFEDEGFVDQFGEETFDIPLRTNELPRAALIHDFTYYLTGSVIFQSSDYDPLTEEAQTLFEGSDFTMEDIILILELIKTTNNFGETVESIILGMLASFLPKDNAISKAISENSGTLFYFQKLIKNCQKHIPKCSIHKIDVCIKGCMAFVGDNVYANHCLECGRKRNLLKPFQKEIFYFPLRE